MASGYKKTKPDIELNWPGKRPLTGIQYHTACLRESFGSPQHGWMNRIYLGDNLHVMCNMLGEFRGKIDLIYIDPPFNTGVNYRQKNRNHAHNSAAELQFTDIWKDCDYLQFMYDRLILMRELLADTGSIYLHCDWHISHYIRLLMDEVFGAENFRNEIAWCYLVNKGHFKNKFPPRHDTILFYAKTEANYFNGEAVRMEPCASTIKRWGAYADEKGEVQYAKLTPGMKKVAGKGEKPYILRGGIQVDWISSIPGINSGNSAESNGYPTQKPEKLIGTFIEASSKPDALVFDCFMGSGSTLAAAMKLGRRFIGADMNPGAVSTTIRRLRSIDTASKLQPANEIIYSGINVFACPDTELSCVELDKSIIFH